MPSSMISQACGRLEGPAGARRVGKMRATLIVLWIAGAAIAGTAEQTDWSGGDGVIGPVIDWGDQFYSDTDVNWSSDPGEVSLGYSPVEHTVEQNFDGAYSVYAEDVDGDGDMDVLGASYYDDDITWWENDDGSGTSWTEHTIDANFDGAGSVYAQDVNGDGDMDVLGAADDDYDITWWENDDGSGTSWTEHTVDGYFYGAESVYAQDVNGDGDMDVLGASVSNDNITWWENDDGSGTSWTEHTVDGDFWGAISVYAEDVDGDGDMDVLGAAAVDDDITWWENVDGSGTSWTERTIDGNFRGTHSVYAQDVDGDGDMDVLGAAISADDITWWENDDGSGTSWTEHTIDANFDGAESVYAQDVDGDGYMDVLGAAYGTDDITWWENGDGSGTSWTEHTVDANFDGAASVYAQDVDGDGYMDVLGAAFLAMDITWWDATNFASEGRLESSILDVQESPEWQDIDWTCTEPAGTSVGFQVRASADPDSMGAWSDTLFSPDSLSGVLADGDSLFQYRAILHTDDPSLSPILDSVSVSWELWTGVEGETGSPVGVFALRGAVPNPARGVALVRFSLPGEGPAELLVYDVAGRVVSRNSDVLPAGRHQIELEGLAAGVYLVRLSAGDLTATERFVVTR